MRGVPPPEWTRRPRARDATAERRRAHSKAMTDARWGAYRAAGDEARAAEQERAASAVGALDDRDLLMLGAAIYWCEGSKSKPWRSQDRLEFVNSDPGLLALFLKFLAGCGIDRDAANYRLLIHESADVDAAMGWWMERLRLPVERFARPTRKRHNVTTVRRNTGDDYHGCLVITVPRSRQLYWRIEGVIAGIRAAVEGLAGE
nr:resolvase [Micromonospora terminaliae]